MKFLKKKIKFEVLKTWYFGDFYNFEKCKLNRFEIFEILILKIKNLEICKFGNLQFGRFENLKIVRFCQKFDNFQFWEFKKNQKFVISKYMRFWNLDILNFEILVICNFVNSWQIENICKVFKYFSVPQIGFRGIFTNKKNSCNSQKFQIF